MSLVHITSSSPQRKFVKLNTIVHKYRSAKFRKYKKKTSTRSVRANLVRQSKTAKPIKVQKLYLGRDNHMPKNLVNSSVSSSITKINSCSKQGFKYNFHDSKTQIESLLLAHQHEIFSSTLPQNAFRQLVKSKAVEIAQKIDVPQRSFKASDKWLNDFLKRCELLGYYNESVRCYSNVVNNAENEAVQLPSSRQTKESIKDISTSKATVEELPSLVNLFSKSPSSITTDSNTHSIQKTTVEELPSLVNLFSKSPPPITTNSNIHSIQKPTAPQVPDLLNLFSSPTSNITHRPNVPLTDNLQSIQSDRFSNPALDIHQPSTSIRAYDQNHIRGRTDIHSNPLNKSHSATACFLRGCTRRTLTKNTLIPSRLLSSKKIGYRIKRRSHNKFLSLQLPQATATCDVYNQLFNLSMNFFGDQGKIDKSLVCSNDDTDSGYRSRSSSKITDDNVLNGKTVETNSSINAERIEKVTIHQTSPNVKKCSISTHNMSNDAVSPPVCTPLINLFSGTSESIHNTNDLQDSFDVFPPVSEIDESIDFDISDFVRPVDANDDSFKFSDSDTEWIESLYS